MAQFDVYANATVASRDGFPCLVVLQGDQLDPFAQRTTLRDALDAVISGV